MMKTQFHNNAIEPLVNDFNAAVEQSFEILLLSWIIDRLTHLSSVTLFYDDEGTYEQ